MAKANASLSQSPTKPNGPPSWDGRITMVHTLAMIAVKDFVKQQLKREGHIVSRYQASDLSLLARDYLETNRARLVEEARQRIAASAMWREMWDKEGRKYERALAAQAKREAKNAKL